MRIVFDTASLITALRSSRGSAGELLRSILNGDLVLLLDLKVSLEYLQVALRDEHLAASGMSSAEMTELLDLLDDLAEATYVMTRRPLSVDPQDDMVLELAISGEADALVSNNRKHFAKPAERFGLQILSPAECLQRLREEQDVRGN